MLQSYLKTAVRFLLKNKTFSLINIFGLSMGTLCCLYIVLYVSGEYSYDKQHTDVKDIYRLTTIWTAQGDRGNWATVTAPVAPSMKHDFPEVLQYARVVPTLGVDNHLLHYNDKAIYEKNAVYADSTLFSIFNFHFVYGTPATSLNNPFDVVLMQPTAYKLFGNVNPVGKTIIIDDGYGKQNFVVRGVIDESLGKSHIQANIFMSMNSGGIGSYMYQNQSWAGTNIAASYVKLAPNTNVAALEKQLPAFLNKYGQAQLKALGMTKELHLEHVSEIHTTPGFRGLELSKTVSPSFLYVLLLIAALIQVIACINFMNLSTARASKRAKEVGVRKVIGAERKDLIRQFLGESFLLSLIGVGIALPLLVLLLPYLNSLTSADITMAFLADYRVWLLMAALIVVTGLVAGSYPAFYLSAFMAIKVIKGNLTNHISAAGIRRALVVFQFALSIILITGIVVIYSQLNYMKNKDLGFDKNQKLIFSFHTGDAQDKMPAFASDIKHLAEVKGVSQTQVSPGEQVIYDLRFFLAGGNIATGPDASFFQADDKFVKTAGLHLIAGRDFRTYDSDKVIINETLVKALGLTLQTAPGTILHTQNANGKPFTLQVAGVIKDYVFTSLHQQIQPMFIWYSPDAGNELLVNVASSDYKTLLSKIESTWHKDVAGVPFEYSFVDDEVQKQYQTEITLSRIINSFTLMAILISCLGLFGLAAFSAEQRSKEIGIRKVLGAGTAGIITLLSNDFLKLVLVAFVIATPISWWAMSQWLQAFAYKVPVTWWMFAFAGVAAGVIALSTVSFQAIKAAVANPIKALKTE